MTFIVRIKRDCFRNFKASHGFSSVTEEEPSSSLKNRKALARQSLSQSNMNVKILLVFTLFLLVASFVAESDAFTAGGGGNLPGKREMAVSFLNLSFRLVMLSISFCDLRFFFFQSKTLKPNF